MTLSKEEIDTLKYYIEEEQLKISDLKKDINFIEQNIRNIKKILFNHCNHDRQIDRFVVCDRTQYICSICEQRL
jgi:hypothetical protein